MAIVVPYDPTWPQQFEAARAEILAAVGDVLLRLEHIGSTSVPGLSAKPIIDMMASVQHLQDGHTAQPALAALGYELVETGMPNRLFFQRRAGPGISTHHLHVVSEDSWATRNELLLRDYLRGDPEQARRYGELKHAVRAGTRSVRDELVAYLEELERRAPGGMVGVPTGFPDLDLLTGGLQGGTLIVVAGPTAAGISTFGLTLARMAAIRAGVSTLVVSLDLPGWQVIHRLLCAEGSIDSQRLLLGRLDERDWTRLTRLLSRVMEAPLTIDASPTMTVDAIATACRQLREGAGLGLVIIDEVGMILPTRPLDDPARERGEVARSLKLLARELAVPVVVLSRLPQPRRVDRRPMLADLSEGERQAAGLVVLLHRPELHDPWTPRRGEADLIVAKHQAGPTDVVTAVFQDQYSRFAPMATRSL